MSGFVVGHLWLLNAPGVGGEGLGLNGKPAGSSWQLQLAVIVVLMYAGGICSKKWSPLFASIYDM